MAGYERETVQALREIAQEMRLIRKAVEGLDRRLATSGGLTAAMTRRAHLIIDEEFVRCSACGAVCGEWNRETESAILRSDNRCGLCGAVLEWEATET